MKVVVTAASALAFYRWRRTLRASLMLAERVLAALPDRPRKRCDACLYQLPTKPVEIGEVEYDLCVLCERQVA